MQNLSQSCDHKIVLKNGHRVVPPLPPTPPSLIANKSRVNCRVRDTVDHLSQWSAQLRHYFNTKNEGHVLNTGFFFTKETALTEIK